MPRRAAGGEHDAIHLQQLLVLDVEPAELRGPVLLEQAAAQRVAHALGLLQDLLQHEVRVAAALDGGEVPVDPRHRLLLFHRVEVEDAVVAGAHHRDLAVVEIHDRARMREDGRGVRSHEVLAGADRHEQRRAVPRRHDRVGLTGREHRDPVRAVHLVQRARHRLDQRAPFRDVLLDQVRQHFRVGLRAEHVAALGEGRAERAGVLDDAVVDERERAAAVGVRVRVDGVGRAVRGPAGVGDARVAGRQRRAQLLLERADLARGLVHLDPAVRHDRDARRVVAAVLEPLQPLEQQRGRVAGPGVAYDAAHERRPSSTSCCASAPVGASAMSRMMGSVFDGRTWSQRSRHASRRPSCVSALASGKRLRNAA